MLGRCFLHKNNPKKLSTNSKKKIHTLIRKSLFCPYERNSWNFLNTYKFFHNFYNISKFSFFDFF